MKNPEYHALIKPEEIIDNSPEPITSLQHLQKFIQEREFLFFNRLAAITHGRPSGRESLIPRPQSLLKSWYLDRQSAVFTGTSLCTLASSVLLDGLKDKVGGLDLDAFTFTTDRVAEEWENPNYILNPISHDVVGATELRSGNTLFFDPTYRQIDHRFPNTILCFKPSEVQKYYKNGSDVVLEKAEISPAIVQDGYLLTTAQYQALVSVLH